jgi:hypothetical protein
VTRDEQNDTITALANKLTRVIDEARIEWFEQYGGVTGFNLIEAGAITRALVGSIVHMYRRVHGCRPAFDHLVSTLNDYPAFASAEAAMLYGVPVVPVSADVFDALEAARAGSRGPVH